MNRLTKITRQLAEDIARVVTRRAILGLQRLTDCLGSGDDSELKNTWDEICVQVQSDQSVMWGAYEETSRAFLLGAIERLKPFEREALWLQTEQGQDWGYEDESEQKAAPVSKKDIVQYLWSEYLLDAAGRWSNPRIRAYLDRAGAID